LADLHLGARLLEWGDHASRRAEEIHRAWDEAVTTAIESRVNAVLVAGDLFDRPDPAPAEHDAVTAGLQRWKEAGIAAVFLPGIYDGLYSLRSVYRPGKLPSWITVANWTEPKRVDLTVGEETLHLHTCALSPGREDLTLWMETGREAAPGVHVGLGHAVLEAQAGVAAWPLPVLESEAVVASGLDLLVLGGAHQFARTRLGETTVVTPGSPVGLRPGEWGPRAWTIAEVDTDGVHLERIERKVAPVAKTTVDLDAEKIRTPQALASRLEAGHRDAAMVSVKLLGAASRQWDAKTLGEAFKRLSFAVTWSEADAIADDWNELNDLFSKALASRRESAGGDDILDEARRYGLGRLSGAGRDHVD
jgi:exonuclease SbcD